MKRTPALLLSTTVSLVLLAAAIAHGQQWSGIISSSRAIDWSKAGIPGGITEPTIQCGATIAPEGTSASPVAPTDIQNAIATCPGGEYVSLGAGTFYLNRGISWWNGNGWNSHVVLRGQGANATFVVFIGSSVGGGTENSIVQIEGSAAYPGSEQNVCNWTAGYSQGATVITLANCGTTTPAMGGLSNLAVGSLLVLDQLDEASDTGTVWNCGINGVCANSGDGGFTRNDGSCNGTACLRSQAQGVIVTGIAGNQITISPGLYMNNWRSGQLPQAWFGTRSITGDAIENLSIDTTNVGGLGHTISIMNCYGCWVSGVRSIDAPRSHVALYMSWHSVVKDSYFYQGQSHGAVSYGIEQEYAWDGLVQNNICQQITDGCPNDDGAAEGNVSAYNFSIDNVYTSAGWFQYSFYHHADGDALNLSEGNIGTGYIADEIHGTHNLETVFRNSLLGQQAAGCDGTACDLQTVPIQLYSGARYFNVIGNVLGQSGYHNNYQCQATSTASCAAGNTSIYDLGYTGNGGGVETAYSYCTSPACTSYSHYDPQVSAYLYRWGNYDTVTAAVRWCGNSSDPGWATTCGSTSEVPAGLPSYANAVPSSTTLPASLYLPLRPNAWWQTPWGTPPWPAIGPDVTGGNIAGVGGHANMIPAELCYLNFMGGVANGTGGVLPFNAASCQVSSLPIAPTNLTSVVQ